MSPTPSTFELSADSKATRIFRRFAYRTFSRCFLSAPSLDLFSPGDPDVDEGARAVLGSEAWEYWEEMRWSAGDERLTSEYAGLFVLPGKQQTFPFETNYREEGADRSRCALGYTAVQVQRTYIEWGMPLDLWVGEQPDHAGVELRFMAVLAAAERCLWVEHRSCCIFRLVQAQAQFFTEHIIQWFPLWLQRLRIRARGPFYRCAARVLAKFLETEQTRFELVHTRGPIHLAQQNSIPSRTDKCPRRLG
jgi:TorA maturation chaperone TorD